MKSCASAALRRGFHALLRESRLPVADIVPDRVVKQNGLLRHDGHLFPQGAQRHFAHVHAVDAQRARRDGVKSRQADSPAWFCPLRSIRQWRSLRRRAPQAKYRAEWATSGSYPKLTSIEFHASRKRRQRAQPRFRFRLFRAANDIRKPCGRSKRLLELLIDSAQSLHGLVGLEQRVDKRDENSARSSRPS